MIKIDTKEQKKMNKHKVHTYLKSDSCFICGNGQTELVCKNKKCPRVFHLSCLNKNKVFKCEFISLIIWVVQEDMIFIYIMTIYLLLTRQVHCKYVILLNILLSFAINKNINFDVFEEVNMFT